MGPKIAIEGWSETYKMQQLKQCTATATTPIVLHADMVPLCQFFWVSVVPFTIFGYENFQIKHFQHDFWSGRKIEEKTLLFTQRLLESLTKI